MASIVVVGAGVAGLACAWRLRHAGHDVEVLESEDAVGGGLRTEELDGYRLELGDGLLGPFDSNTRVVLKALGLEGEIYPLQPADEGVLRRGRFEILETSSLRAFARSPLLSAGAKLRLGRLGVELAARRSILDVHHPEFAAPLELNTAADDLTAVAGGEARDFALAPLLRAWTRSPLDVTSDAFARLLLYSLLTGSRVPEGLVGGMGQLSRALADQVPVRVGARVVSVETEEGGACVRYRIGGRERRAYADAAVVAIGAPDIVSLCPKLEPDERGYLQAIECPPAVVVHALLDEVPRAQPFHRVHLPDTLGFSIATIGLEHVRRGAAPAGRGLLRIVLTGEAARKALDTEDSRLGRQLVDEIERTPLGAVRVRRFVVDRRPQGPPRFGPGMLGRLRRFVDRTARSPRLAFAGSHAVGPYTEGALTSGLRAAADVVRGLG